MVLRFALASARARAPFLALAAARVRLPATYAITLRGAPHLLGATRGLFAVRCFAVTPTPFCVPFLVRITDGGVLRALTGTFGVVDNKNGFVAESLQVLRHNLHVAHIARHTSLVSWFVNTHRSLASMQLDDERQVACIDRIRFHVVYVRVTVYVFQPDGVTPDAITTRQ